MGTALLAELPATARALTIGATGTKALAPATTLKNARDVFIVDTLQCLYSSISLYAVSLRLDLPGPLDMDTHTHMRACWPCV